MLAAESYYVIIHNKICLKNKRQFLLSEITCQRPQTNDMHLFIYPWKDLYSYNQVITFSCSEGYRLTRSMSLMCGKSGNFQGTLPTCAGKIHIILFGYDAITFQKEKTL